MAVENSRSPIWGSPFEAVVQICFNVGIGTFERIKN